MQKTIFKINKMDCPSEEQMIRMKLDDLTNIKLLDFDIANRQLTVMHTDDYESIFQHLDSLNFDATVVESIFIDNEISQTVNNEQDRKLLWKFLAINFFFFILELATGFFSNSMGLIADSLDMLADSIVYGLALFAVGGTLILKIKVAKVAGYFQLLLAILGFVEVIRRFVGVETVPTFQTMMLISVLALFGNGICLYLLQKSKNKESHIQASIIFTSNDVIVNFGVILAGAFVYITNSNYPDLAVGTLVFFIVANGAFKILKLSK